MGGHASAGTGGSVDGIAGPDEGGLERDDAAGEEGRYATHLSWLGLSSEGRHHAAYSSKAAYLLLLARDIAA